MDVEGMYSVVFKGRKFTDLTFLEALRKVQESFESSPNKGIKIEMWRQLA
jgi:hypothetical protein